VDNIVTSLRAVALLVSAAVVFALGAAFLVAADASLSPTTLGASDDLGQASRWLQFIAAAIALGAVCVAGWQLVLRSEPMAALEVAVVAVGALFVVIGSLTAAAYDDSGGTVTGAVGIGIWALLVLSRAARTSLAENGSRGGLAELWLLAAGGLFVLAIGYGLSSAATSTGPAVAAGLLEAVGAAALAACLFVARSRGRLTSKPATAAVAGLATLAASFLATGIVAGVSFSSLSGEGDALAVTGVIALAAVVLLGVAAWIRVTELYRPTAA
jgi:hypothetical protein